MSAFPRREDVRFAEIVIDDSEIPGAMDVVHALLARDITAARINRNPAPGGPGSKSPTKKGLAMANGKKAKTTEETVVPLKIVKPKSVFERFKSTKAPTISGVSELLTALPLLKISDANDYVRLSPAEEHWSPEMCFVAVPVHGEKQPIVHCIDEEIAMKYLSAKRIKRFRLALASKPYDNFFLAVVPTTNRENSWNSSMLAACEQAKSKWLQAVSLKSEGKDKYKIEFAHDQDAFPEPQWPTDMESLVEVTFHDKMIETEDHPALSRLIGRKQDLA